jgi:AcrR family transcriptional regulator
MPSQPQPDQTTDPRQEPKPDARARLHEAALRIVAEEGPGASVRAISRAAGVSEGALYRHYQSREELLGAVFAEQIAPMVAHKEALVAMRASMEDRLREWVRSTYDRFDRDPIGFAYVFLTDHELPEAYADVAGRQSALLRELITQGQTEGSLRAMDPGLAAAMFVGLLLSVPDQIRRGRLRTPAASYTDEIARAAWRSLRREPGG